jgi:hypothetical protein
LANLAPSGNARLLLYHGIGRAVPAARMVIEAIQSITVQVPASGQSGFEITLGLGQNRSLEELFLPARPLHRVVIAVELNGTPQILIDGVMTRYQLVPGSPQGPATLTIMGKDLTALMDMIELYGVPYPGMPDEARIALILAKYAAFGVIPKIIPSINIDTVLPTKRIPQQRGTDYAYVRGLADGVGYIFRHEPGVAVGQSFAYWGPEIKVGAIQPSLNVDMDELTNVKALSFAFDDEKNKLPIVFLQLEEAHVPIPIPIPSITPLNPPLGAVPPLPKGLRNVPGTAKLSPMKALAVALAKAAQAAEAVTGSGRLDVTRYGRILKPGGLVGVRGAGVSFDGLHYVKGVTHTIARGSYEQSFQLSRNGLISTLPRVPV